MWMCCCRPDVIVKKESGDIVGSVELPCLPPYLCKIELKVYTGANRDAGSHLWTIKKCCCNCHTLFGKACGCCLGAAQTMDLEVLDSKGAATKGKIQKQYNGLVNECFNMADKYGFDYPSDSDDEKALFLAAIQFLDMLFFEYNYWGEGNI